MGSYKRKESSARGGTWGGRTPRRGGGGLVLFVLRRKFDHDFLSGRNELVEGEGLNLIIIRERV